MIDKIIETLQKANPGNSLFKKESILLFLTFFVFIFLLLISLIGIFITTYYPIFGIFLVFVSNVAGVSFSVFLLGKVFY